MKQVEIARALGLARNTISKAVKAGMPTDSIESVMAWRKQRAEAKARSFEVRRKNGIIISAKYRVGKHGLGRAHRGRLDHFGAKEWTIQSPNGKRYTFPNLAEWCRRNEHLFDDGDKEYKLPLCIRAKCGLVAAANLHRSSWHGWIVIDRGPLPTTTKR